jgi:hypothetical protein
MIARPPAVRVTPRRGPRLALVAGVLLGALALWLWWPAPEGPAQPEERKPAGAAEPPDAPAQQQRQQPSFVNPSPPRAPAPPPPTAPPATPPKAEPEEQGHSAFDLFPEQKRRPHLLGYVVPEGFPLPEGYIRHYQTAHYPEGLKQLPPILMYDFGYQPRDRQGNPLPLPEDRVVPLDQLPPGMPAVKLEVPETEYQSDER